MVRSDGGIVSAMPDAPQHISVLAHTVNGLRTGIASGEWTELMPPERALCEQLGISRSTLRRAMLKIAEEGLIDEGRSGTRRRILAKPKLGATANTRSKSVILLTRKPLPEISSVNLRLIAQLQSQLTNHGCIFRVVRIPDKVLANPEVHMKEWLGTVRGDVWILHQMPGEVQRWFNKHQQVSCILGSPAPEVDLASVEVDSLSAMTHAVATARRLRHRHIALARPSSPLVGEDQLEDRLRELSGVDVQTTVLTCPMDAGMMAVEFERLIARGRGGSQATVIICSIPEIALFALTWLQQHRIPVPGEMSVILLRSQPLLEFTSPSLAHYELNEERAVVQILPRVLDLLQSQVCATSHINLIPEFVPGGSLGPAKINK
ncbi:MAG: DNA-binding LacI/PurR family transcriptional regulator, partial [Verrucomicrobiales bacterium]